MGFWNGKRVMVTGGCGMVGCQMVPMLREAGAEVTVLANHFRPPGEMLDASVRYFMSDAGEPEQMRNALTTHPSDVLLNLAASVSGIFWNLDHQATQLYLNMRLQLVPLLVAAEAEVPVFLQVSSVCVYDPLYNAPACEPLGRLGEPTTGYAWGKRMGEVAADYMKESYPGRIVTVRPSNMYGENDHFGERVHVVPGLIKQFLDPDVPEIVLFSHGRQTREFLHAEDGARGMLAAAERGRHGEVYNLGTDGETNVSILALAEKIRAILGTEKPIRSDPSREPLDMDRIVIAEKAHRHLNWRYQIGLDEGLRRTIEWFTTSKSRRGIEVEE
jgi:nucleoside-diphosphate-sugar epimerase